MEPTPAERHTFSVPLDCHYLLQTAGRADPHSLLIVALHGYGQNAEVMLRLTRGMAGPGHAIACVQAPHQFYLDQGTPHSAIGYNWGVRDHWASNVRLHHGIVRAVIHEAGARLGFGPERVVLVGFSQSVGLNYRFAGTHPGEVRGVIGICGGVPRDWEQGSYRTITAALLHIAREEDEFYPPATTRLFPERLRRYASDVEFHLLPGGHRFPSKAGPIFENWAKRFAER